MDVLTEGNAAKLYCLDWIARYAADKPAVTILDLGCGDARNFVRLLRQNPRVFYVGVEPSPAACEAARANTAGLNATILNAYAYDVFGRLVKERFDLLVSFSVFEHVYRRLDYLRAARACIKDDGYFLINYDAGHFVYPKNARERLKNYLGPLLARLGAERYFQAFVRQADFEAMLSAAGFVVEEAKSFNTTLKGIYRGVPEPRRAEYMRRWVELEDWLNTLDIPYDDRHARTWTTRNYILRPAG